MRGKSHTCVNCKCFGVRGNNIWDVNIVCDKKNVVLLSGDDVDIVNTTGYGVEMRCFENDKNDMD